MCQTHIHNIQTQEVLRLYMNDLLGLLDMETRAVANGGQQETNRAGKSEHYFLSVNSKWQLVRTRSTFQSCS